MTNNNLYPSWEAAGINVTGKLSGHFYCICPECSSTRKAKNQKKKCLLVDLETKRFRCFNDGCDYEGYIATGKAANKTYQKPTPIPAVKDPITDEWARLFFKRGISLDTLRKYRCLTTDYAFPDDIEYGENNTQKWHKSSAMVFPYYYKGELLYYKYRGLKKQFAMSKDPQLIFWNIDCLFDCTNGKYKNKEEIPYCIVCEGEVDALTWLECGYEYVVSVPNGASKNSSEEYVDRCIVLFDKVKVVYLSVDADAAGSGLRQKLARRFGKDRCKIVDYSFQIKTSEGEREAKDINEVLENYDKEAVKYCFDNAHWHPIRGVKTMRDYEVELDDVYKNGRKPFKKIGLTALDEIFTWNDGRALTVISGAPQSAKSQLSFNVAVRLAYFYQMKWAVFSPETGDSDAIAQRLIEILTGEVMEKNNVWKLPQLNSSKYAWAKSFVNQHFYIICETEMEEMTFDNFLTTCEKLVKTHGINGAIADPVNSFEDMFGAAGEMMSKGLNDNLVKAKTVRAKHDLHLILVPHPIALRGKTRLETSYDINGGAGWNNHADNILLSNREYGTAQYSNGFRGDNIEIIVDKCKFAHAGKKGEVKFAYHVPTGIFGNITNFNDVSFENAFVWNKATDEKRTNTTFSWDNIEGNVPIIATSDSPQDVPF